VASSTDVFPTPFLAIPSGSPRTELAPKQLLLSDHTSDEDLITRLCEGDKEALACLFRRHARLIRGIAYRVLRDSVEADDMAQDVFVLINRLCGTFDKSKSSAVFWIVQMTYRRSISRRRYLTSRQFYTRVDLDDDDDKTSQSLSSPSNRFGSSIDQRLATFDLQRMFEGLSENQQRTLRLHFIEGYTLEETAEMLGQSKRRIKQHSFRGMERLRRQISRTNPQIFGIRK
jgi:RNA polymerase sigma-70 factor (ECF subfamily)